MKNDSRDVSGYSGKSNTNRFAGAFVRMMAAFKKSGDRMEKMCLGPSSKRVVNLRARSVAKEFRPRGGLYRSFFACCAEISSACACDKRVLAKFKPDLDIFYDRLAECLCYDHADAVAKFSTLVESMVDLAEEDHPFDVHKERSRLTRIGEKVFYDLSIQVKAREMQLRVPVMPTPMIDGGPKAPPGRDEVKERLRNLVRRIIANYKDVHTINDAVDLIRSPKPGVPYYADAKELNKEIKCYGWSEETIRQYAKDIGKHRKSRQCARIQAKRRKNRRMVERDTRTNFPPK